MKITQTKKHLSVSTNSQKLNTLCNMFFVATNNKEKESRQNSDYFSPEDSILNSIMSRGPIEIIRDEITSYKMRRKSLKNKYIDIKIIELPDGKYEFKRRELYEEKDYTSDIIETHNNTDAIHKMPLQILIKSLKNGDESFIKVSKGLKAVNNVPPLCINIPEIKEIRKKKYVPSPSHFSPGMSDLLKISSSSSFPDMFQNMLKNDHDEREDTIY